MHAELSPEQMDRWPLEEEPASEMHQVVIVGAGPAGSSLAAELAREDIDVLLIDRQEFPRDKICGDAVSAGTVDYLGIIGMRDKIITADFHEITRFELHSSRNFVWSSRLPLSESGSHSYIVPRLVLVFDAFIQAHAVESGAKFLHASVQHVIWENDQVRGILVKDTDGKRKIHARVVVGADGATS